MRDLFPPLRPVNREPSPVEPSPVDPSPVHPDTDLLIDLFGEVPHVMVCVKDADGRYTAANAAFVRRARCRHAGEVIGRRAADLFAAELAASYDAQDRAVLLTGRPIRNHLEPIEDRAGERRWYLTSKVRTSTIRTSTVRTSTVRRATHDRPVVVVVSVEAQLGGDAASGLRAAIELAHARFPGPIRVGELAEAAGMSTDRLERAMRRTLGLSPKQYLLRLRAEHAARMLASTEWPIVRIAAECGYYDQSQLTRQFRDHLGLSPGQYRTAAGR